MRRLQPRRSRGRWGDPMLPNGIWAMTDRMEFGAKGRSATRSAYADHARDMRVASTQVDARRQAL